MNVRLDSERIRKTRSLLERGVVLSDVVREAIDDRYERIVGDAPRDTRALVKQIFEQYPDPEGLPPRDYDVHDRVASRAAILRRLRRSK